MSVLHGPTGLVHDARDLAQVLLVTEPQRWRQALVAAARLHDIGHGDLPRDTGFHPLDGARYLHRHQWPVRLAGLVAHHSEASSVARVRGLADDLARFPDERSLVSDALAYADQTVGPDGRAMRLEERWADMLRRHGQNSPNAVAHPRRAPLLRAAVHRIEQRLADAGRSSAA